MLHQLLDRYVYPRRLRATRCLAVGPGLRVKGWPSISVHKEARIEIGANVSLLSRTEWSHVSLYAAVRLVADRPGAVIQIGDNTRIHGSCIHAYQSIVIGQNCLIAGNTQIIDGSAHDLCWECPEKRIHTRGAAKAVVVEDNVWIGTGSIILPGVTIGSGSVIAAGSIVIKDIPPLSLAGGNPARVIRSYAGGELAAGFEGGSNGTV